MPVSVGIKTGTTARSRGNCYFISRKDLVKRFCSYFHLLMRNCFCPPQQYTYINGVDLFTFLFHKKKAKQTTTTTTKTCSQGIRTKAWYFKFFTGPEHEPHRSENITQRKLSNNYEKARSQVHNRQLFPSNFITKPQIIVQTKAISF